MHGHRSDDSAGIYGVAADAGSGEEHCGVLCQTDYSSFTGNIRSSAGAEVTCNGIQVDDGTGIVLHHFLNCCSGAVHAALGVDAKKVDISTPERATKAMGFLKAAEELLNGQNTMLDSLHNRVEHVRKDIEQFCPRSFG